MERASKTHTPRLIAISQKGESPVEHPPETNYTHVPANAGGRAAVKKLQKEAALVQSRTLRTQTAKGNGGRF